MNARDGVVVVSHRRARLSLVSDRMAAYTLCVGGLAMGYFVAHATSLRGAKFTALGGLPGWPEIWGAALLVFGLVAVAGRFIDRRIGYILLAGGMACMACWYALFASSLILGTGQYGFVPYYALAGLHVNFAIKGWMTNGYRPEGLGKDKIAAAFSLALGLDEPKGTS